MRCRTGGVPQRPRFGGSTGSPDGPALTAALGPGVGIGGEFEPSASAPYALRMGGCRSCGYENAEGAKFCSECGLPLVAFAPAARAERKVLTVLFADLVGFTGRAEGSIPKTCRRRSRRTTSGCVTSWSAGAGRWRNSSAMR
jgi:hypothetical protein